jgi:hypothetical protein
MRRSRPAFRRRWAPSALAMILATMGVRARADDERISLRAELGLEYDSNVHRAEQIEGANGPGVVGSPLTRAVLGWSAADRVGTGQDVAFSLLGGVKAFTVPDARSENVGVFETSGAWRILVGPRMRVGVAMATYEAVQAGTRTEQQLSGQARDFRSLAPSLRVFRAVGERGTVSLAAGYRWFVYKPLRSYDFGAPVLSAEYHLRYEASDGDADWDVVAGGGVELRRFAGTRLVPTPTCTSSPCTPVLDPIGTRHADQFFSGHLEVVRTGRILIGAAYAIQWNRSNSYAEALLRHVATIRFTTPLPMGVYLAARTELVKVNYADSVALATGPSGQPSASIDDENRSHIRAELSRDVGKHLQVVGRYSLYVNALGQGRYLRQTATLSLAFTID